MVDTTTEPLSGRFRLTEHLAQGGMGDVYVAEDLESDGDRVVVKLLRGTTPRDLRRFESEAEALSRLDHPAIVGFLETGQHDDTPYIVMEFVDGPSMKGWLERGPLDLDDAGRIGREVAEALAFAHERGIVHRDVKPSNVLLADGGGGRAKVADFGIARLIDVTSNTTTDRAVGTAAYLAPEQLRSGDVGPPTDVYALGLVLIEAITGERPFGGTASETTFARLQQDPAVPTDLPEGWRSLLRMMTARRPEARPSMERVAEILVDGHPDAAAITDDAPTAELSTSAIAAAGGGSSGVAAHGDEDPSGSGRQLAIVGGLIALLAIIGVIGLLVVLADDGADRAEEPGDVPDQIEVDEPTDEDPTDEEPAEEPPPDADDGGTDAPETAPEQDEPAQDQGGRPDSPPGQDNGPPGQEDGPPGQGDDPPGQDRGGGR